MAALKIIYNHMATKFRGRQPFTAEEPFGPLFHSNENHHRFAEHKRVPQKKVLLLSVAIHRVSTYSINAKEPQIAGLWLNILKPIR